MINNCHYEVRCLSRLKWFLWFISMYRCYIYRVFKQSVNQGYWIIRLSKDNSRLSWSNTSTWPIFWQFIRLWCLSDGLWLCYQIFLTIFSCQIDLWFPFLQLKSLHRATNIYSTLWYLFLIAVLLIFVLKITPNDHDLTLSRAISQPYCPHRFTMVNMAFGCPNPRF